MPWSHTLGGAVSAAGSRNGATVVTSTSAGIASAGTPRGVNTRCVDAVTGAASAAAIASVTCAANVGANRTPQNSPTSAPL